MTLSKIIFTRRKISTAKEMNFLLRNTLKLMKFTDKSVNTNLNKTKVIEVSNRKN